jgi:uncharacterized protein (DUF488 family)
MASKDWLNTGLQETKMKLMCADSHMFVDVTVFLRTRKFAKQQCLKGFLHLIVERLLCF